jgi:abortive infection bacteriophage resistance protein
MLKNKQKYNKPPLSISEQIVLLKSRGLVVEDEEKLRYYLENISYYHLSIYFKYFQIKDDFQKGTNFEDVLRIYVFDNKLRFLLLELLERIENSFKCRMAYELSIATKDSHCLLNKELFISESTFKESLNIITEEFKKSREISIIHYKETYKEPFLPPIWILIEILSFGQSVKISKLLKREYKNKISRTLEDDEQFIMSWMHCLSVLRNNCAHYSRLWNRDLTLTPKSNHKTFEKYFVPGTKRIFNYLVVLQILLRKINPASSWLGKLKELVEGHKIEVLQMGFPEDWESRLNQIQKET